MIRHALAALVLTLGLALSQPRDAEALTISLDFVTGPTTDLFGVGTTSANYAPFGFTTLAGAGIEAAILSAVTQDYLGFPTATANPSSPLAAGKQLNIDFVMATSAIAPSNGDLEFYHVAIGTRTGFDAFLGQACLSCVRNASGAGPNFGLLPGGIVGSILVDNIAALANLAASDAARINLLAGTISHEIGHVLSLEHPDSALPNPGESAFSLMATGAPPTLMPNNQRILDRDFAFAEFAQLINAVGVRDVVEVAEPGSLALFALGSVVIAFRTRRRMPAHP